jgi:hypothetical protein
MMLRLSLATVRKSASGVASFPETSLANGSEDKLLAADGKGALSGMTHHG